MSNIVIFGATQSGKTTLLGYLSTAMLRHPQFNDEILKKFKLIKKLMTSDEFSIGSPYNPVNVNTDVILPSFVSLDKNELRKFRGQEYTEGTTKRIHRTQLSICMSERNGDVNDQNENENLSCIFLDLPGFRQRLSDKYRGFFEGDIGVAVVKLQEVLELYELINCSIESSDLSPEEIESKISEIRHRIFEPIRIWCDYRSPSKLLIALSQIDRNLNYRMHGERAREYQIDDIRKAIQCIELYTDDCSRGTHIPISPISIKITSEKNRKNHPRMSMFFHREEENIYTPPICDNFPGDGTFISCLKKIMSYEGNCQDHNFSMATVDRPMRAIVNNAHKTALNVHALHGAIHLADIVTLGPVVDKRDNTTIFAECDISSMKADGVAETSRILLEGNVGGLIFNSIKTSEASFQYNLSYMPKESNIALLKSTILFNGRVEYGDIIELVIDKSEYITTSGGVDDIYDRVLRSLMPFDEIILFWYGKKVLVNIIERVVYENRIKLSVILSKLEKHSTRYFVVPVEDGGVIKHQDSVLLAIPRVYYSSRPAKEIQGLFTYVSADIVDVKNSESYDQIRLEAENSMCIDSALNETVHFSQETISSTVSSYTIPINERRKTGTTVNVYSVMPRVARNIKRWTNRLSYRSSDSFKMILKKANSQ